MLGDLSEGEAGDRLVENAYRPAVVLQSSLSGIPSTRACVHIAVSLEVIGLHP